MKSRTEVFVSIVIVVVLALFCWLYVGFSQEDDQKLVGSSKAASEATSPQSSLVPLNTEALSNRERQFSQPGKLAGFVGDAADHPISGAAVSIIKSLSPSISTPSPILSEVETDSHGMFFLDRSALSSLPDLFIMARHPDHDPVFRRLSDISRNDDRNSQFKLTMETESSVGIVVDAEGQQILKPLVSWILYTENDRNSSILRVQCGPRVHGEFQCLNRRRKNVGIEITTPTSGTIVDENLFDNELDRENRIVFSTPSGAELRVRFVASIGGESVSQLPFRLLDPSGGIWMLGMSNEQGEATIARYPFAKQARIELLSDAWHLSTVDDPSALRHLNFQFPICLGQGRSIEVFVSKGCSISGVLVDGQTNIPLPGVAIRCVSNSVTGYHKGVIGTTNSDGTFAFTNVAGGWSFLSLGDGDFTLDVDSMLKEFEPTRSAFQRQKEGASKNRQSLPKHRVRVDRQFRRLMIFLSDAVPRADVVVRALPLSIVSGSVTREGDAPVGNLRIVLVKENSVFGLNARLASVSSTHDAVTSQDGLFQIRQVPPGKWKALCEPKFGPSAESASFDVASGHDRDSVKIHIPSTMPYYFTVADRDHIPVSGVGIRIFLRGSGINRTTTVVDEIETNELGEAISTKMTIGNYFVEFFVTYILRLTTSPGFDAGIHATETGDRHKNVAMTKAFYLIGRVLDDTDKPIAKGYVSFELLTENGRWRSLEYIECRTDNDGRFKRAVNTSGVFRIKMVSVPGPTGTRNFFTNQGDTISPGIPNYIFHASQRKQGSSEESVGPLKLR